jgi:ADP-heptose:LPS heptosyltransferase
MALTARTRDFAPTVVALRALGLGDLLTAVPAWRALERAFRGYRRILATPRALAPIVRLLGAEHLAVEGLTDLGATPTTVAVNLHGRGPESDSLLLARRPSRLMAFANGAVPETAGGPAWDPDEHEVERWCRLLTSYDVPADPSDLDLDLDCRHVVRAERVTPGIDADTTVIHPGAGSGARRWPAGRYAAVARAERSAGRRVVVTGAVHERPLALEVARAASIPWRDVAAGRTDVGALAGIVGRAGRVICGDTGVAHLATALRTPSVVLFGPTSPSTWGPPPRARHVVLWAGHTGNPHAPIPDDALLEIQVEDVLRAVATLPNRSPSDGAAVQP